MTELPFGQPPGPDPVVASDVLQVEDRPTAEPDGAAPGRATPGRRRSTLRNAIANGLGRGVSVVISFVLTPVILHAVGTEAFGLWVLIGSVVAYGSLLDLGIGGALTKYIAEHRARGEHDAGRALVASGLRLYLVMGIVTAFLGLALSAILPSVLAVPAGLVEDGRRTTALMGLGLGVAIPCTTGVAVLRGLHRYDVAASVAVVGSLVSALTTLLALGLGWGIVGIVALGIPIPVLTQALALLAIRRLAPELVVGQSQRAPGMTRRIVGFSWPLFLLDVAGRLQTKTDEIVVGVALSLGSVTPYALGRKLSTIPRLVAEQFAMTLLPMASELDARSDQARLQALYLTGVRVSLAIALPLTAALAVLAGPILDAWVGPGYGDGGPVVVILVVAAAIDLSLWPAGFVLQGIGRHRWLGPISLASGIANLALSLALAAPLGLVGIAIGTLIPTAVEAALVLTPFTLRALDIGARRYLAEALVPALGPVVPAGLLAAAAMQVLPPRSLGAIVVLVALIHAGYGLVYLAQPIAGPERRLARDLVGAVRHLSARATARP